MMTSITPIPNVAGAVVTLIGTSVLVGWVFHISWLVRLGLGAAPVQPISALAFILLGLGLLRRQSPETKILGVTGLLLGAIALAQYATSHLGVMAPGTATGVAMAGLALQCRKHPVLQALTGSLVLALGAVPLLGYAAGLESAYLWGEHVSAMAMRSALCLILLGGGIILDGHERARNEWASAVVGAIVGLAVAVGTRQALLSEGAPLRLQGVVVAVLCVGAGLMGWLLWSLERMRRLECERDDALAAREGLKQAKEAVVALKLLVGRR